MADLEGLVRRYDSLSRDIIRLARLGKKIIVVTHVDADGLASGSVVFSALTRQGANVAVRSVSDLDPRRIQALSDQQYDFYVFTDLGSTLVRHLESALDGKFLVLDHHQLAEEDMNNPAVVNAWKYGYDGGREACSTAMAYFFACSVDVANRDLAYLAVVGAVADRQDGGPERSITGLNRAAMEDALSAAMLRVSKDFLFTGRETRPIHDSVSLTSSPYLPGVTGNGDAVLAALHRSGIRLKDGGSWRTVSSLGSDEKMKLTETIAGMLEPASGGAEAFAGLVGEVYTFELEDAFTPLRDAREFGTLLNACGRMGMPGVGMAICLGDRAGALKSAMKTLSEYRLGITGALQALNGDASRTTVIGRVVMVSAEDLVEERLLGPVTSILTSTPAYRDKVVIARTKSGETELKISSRVGDSYSGTVNLGLVMREVAEASGGVGGGHSMAGGAKIPNGKADEFAKGVLERIPP